MIEAAERKINTLVVEVVMVAVVGRCACILGVKSGRRCRGNYLISLSNHNTSTHPPNEQRHLGRAWHRNGYPRVNASYYFTLSCSDVYRIYKEIGPGKRIALSKLAVDTFEKTGRPLRIAIDTSIWLFQIQASKGRRSRYNGARGMAIH